jgi:aminopeptidase
MDIRIKRMAELLTDYSAQIRPGDRVLIEAETEAEPLVRALFEAVLEHGGHPYLQISFSGQVSSTGLDDIFFERANSDQLDHPSSFRQRAYDEFEARFVIHSSSNTRSLANIGSQRIAQRRKALQPILHAQFQRGDRGEFRWVTTLYPTSAYAQEADMGLAEYEDFVFMACHVHDSDTNPADYWMRVEKDQQKWVDAFAGHSELVVRGPNCDLRLSIRDRTFINASGRRNMPDGEIFTGPVEDSVNGWMLFTLPIVFRGIELQGVKISFENGKAVEIEAQNSRQFLLETLNTDAGASFLGEFGIGTNYGIQRYTKNTLFDEKIGGTIHVAFGSGYPITGSKNKSAIHWDMVCDVREDSEMVLDGEVIYREGAFLS